MTWRMTGPRACRGPPRPRPRRTAAGGSDPSRAASGGPVGGLALGLACRARGPCSRSVVERRVLDADDVRADRSGSGWRRAAGRGPGRGRGPRRRRRPAKSPVASRPSTNSPAAGRRGSTPRPSAFQSATTLGGREQPGVGRLGRAQDLDAQRILGLGQVPAVGLLRPAGVLERLGRGGLRRRARAGRRRRRTAASSAGSGRSRSPPHGVRRVDERRPVDGLEQRRPDLRRRRTRDGSARRLSRAAVERGARVAQQAAAVGVAERGGELPATRPEAASRSPAR